MATNRFNTELAEELATVTVSQFVGTSWLARLLRDSSLIVLLVFYLSSSKTV